MKATLRMTALLAAAGLALTACGGGDVATDDETTAAPAGDTATDSEVATEAPTSEGEDATDPATAGGELETTSLTVGAIPIADTAPLHYAVAEGMFEDAGLDVTIATSQGGAAGVPALVSGDRDLDIGNYISIVQARESGVDIVSYPYILEHPQDAVVLASAADSAYTSVEDLEGEQVTIAINTLGNLGEVLVRNAWDQAGLDWNNVEVAQIPFPEMVPAMQRGDVDLAWLPEPFLTIAQGDGANIVLDTVTEGPPIDGALISGPVSATREFAEANPNTMAAFMGVLTEAGNELNENRDAAEAIIAEYTGLPPAVVSNLELPTYAPDASVERVQAFLDMSATYGVVPEVDASEFYITP